MKQILPPIKTVHDLCGMQKYREGLVYRASNYRITASCGEGILLYQTLTKELLLLETGETETEHLEELVKRWFFVPEDCNERKQVDEVLAVARILQKKKEHKTCFTILTTSDCNARCFYCYEMGVRRMHMTPETACGVANYIASVCGGKKVKLSWFGGEPLYNKEVIDIICDILQKKGIEYTSILTSNAYYLDSKTAEKAVRDWHVTHTQITIDGTEEVYNRTKAYIDREETSPYQRVLKNIGTALDTGMEIAIRLNMDRANEENLYALADEIADRFGNRKNLFIHVALLRKAVGEIHAFDTQEEAEEARRKLNQKLAPMGYLIPRKLQRSLVVNHCMADNDTSEVILPDGQIEKCEHLDEKEIIGSIYSEERNGAIIQSWKEQYTFAECEKCALYPSCIRLKKCFWQEDHCGGEIQRRRIETVRELMLQTYEESKTSKEEKG